MFNQKPTRTQIAVIAVTAMLVLAGCSTGTTGTGIESDAEPQEPTTTTVSTETETDGGGSDETFDPDYGPETGQNLTEYGNERGVGTAGLNETEQQRVQELVTGFYDNLDETVENDSKRRAVVLESAEKLCEKDRTFENELNRSMLKEGGDATGDAVRRADYAAQIANEFNSDVPVDPLGDIRDGTSEVTKYAPLIGSYNQMSDKACAASELQTEDAASEEQMEEAIQEYQIATVMFGVDAMLISTGAFYQPAFVSTRFAANKASQLGLYRLRYVCGNRCWALAMSEVHVWVRGSMLTGTSALLRQAGEMGADLNQEDLEAIADEHDTDVDKMLENVDSSTASDVLDSVTDDAVKCRDAVLESDDEGSGGDGFFGGDGIDTGDVVEKGEEALNKSAQAVEDCRNGGE
ncbi:hypothetical protein [Natrinema versiforme]|uniref:Uncharacterized protein n=1 Tax=Natrinema versiforme TaxID=88724 RepID=A0A4P8WMJ2_9EURY|nr:hypothetical protein [Natrinema versiforme]QCS44740.1 hypothetical protein FEJ81_20920 [Natrinema versiforme]